MVESDRIERLTKRMTHLWAGFWDDGPGFRQQDAKRIRDTAQWSQQVGDLKAQLLLYLEGGHPSLDDLLERYCDMPLVWLVALDGVLWAHCAHMAGDREPPTEVPHDGTRWMVFPRHRPLGPTVYQNQSYHVRNHLLYHHIVPGKERGNDIRVSLPGPLLRKSLRSLVDSQRPIKCYLGSFADGICPDWNGRPDGRCTCSRLEDPAGRHVGLRRALEEARDLKADVVVLPELSLCPGLRDAVCCWLHDEPHPFLMVVPGSFHERLDPRSEMPVNRTYLLDGKGRPVLSHDKMIPMGTGNVCFEVIEPGECLHLLKTPLGLVALVICRDFLEEDASVALPWQKIAPDWAFVPSMTPIQGVRSHEQQAKSLSRCCGTRSLVPNQCPVGTYYPDNSHGFACWPDPNGQVHLHPIQPASRLVSIPVCSRDGSRADVARHEHDNPSTDGRSVSP